MLTVLDVCYLSHVSCVAAADQDMKRRNSYGHIINMVGLSGHRIPDAAAGGTFYSATKFAVKAVTEGLRQEVRFCVVDSHHISMACDRRL